MVRHTDDRKRACDDQHLDQATWRSEKMAIRTEAKVQVLKEGEGFAIKKIDLTTTGRVPGVDDATFQQTAQAAKESCPVSKALAAVPEINLIATLEG